MYADTELGIAEVARALLELGYISAPPPTTEPAMWFRDPSGSYFMYVYETPPAQREWFAKEWGFDPRLTIVFKTGQTYPPTRAGRFVARTIRRLLAIESRNAMAVDEAKIFLKRIDGRTYLDHKSDWTEQLGIEGEAADLGYD
jgi:hypothetical protein